jgi:small-conductance mechanosensitive channel
MILATDILNRAAASLGEGLPRIAGALILLVVGLLLARLVARLVARLLRRAGVDDLSERWGVADVLERARLPRPLSKVAGAAVRIAIAATVIFASLSLLGLQFLSQSLNEAVLFLPSLLVALALLLAGVVVAAMARSRVERASAQMDLPMPLGRTAEILIVAVFAITAAAQVSISLGLLMIVLGVLLAGVVSTVALAFGLGGREVARAVSAGRYLRGAFLPGQRISFAETSGTVRRVDSTMTVLSDPQGREVRVPNHMLIENIVTIESTPPDDG